MSGSSGRLDRRNTILLISEGVFFLMGASLISSQTVLPALVTRLGGGSIAVGALGVLTWVGLFLPQIFAARITQTLRWKQPWSVWVGLAQRLIVLAMGIGSLTLSNSRPGIILVVLLMLVGLNQLLMGVATPGWFDMYAKLTRLERRGRIAGIKNAFAGAGSFAASFLLTWLLGFKFPQNYAFAILGAFILQIISTFLQKELVEEHPSETLPRQPTVSFLRDVRSVLSSNDRFRSFIRASIFLVLATMPLSFFTVYGLEKFRPEESVVGEFTATMVLGQILGAVVTGYMADRWGNKLALICSASSMGLASILAMSAPSIKIFMIVFLLVGINLGSEVMIRYNLAIEYGPVERRSTYVGLTNTLLAPFYLSGFIAAWVGGTLGYRVLFGVGGTCSAAGVLYLIMRVKDPRAVT